MVLISGSHTTRGVEPLTLGSSSLFSQALLEILSWQHPEVCFSEGSTASQVDKFDHLSCGKQFAAMLALDPGDGTLHSEKGKPGSFKKLLGS